MGILKHITSASSKTSASKAGGLLSACLFVSMWAQAQKYVPAAKIDLPIYYSERYKFAINKIIDSTFYIFKTDMMAITEISPSTTDTLFIYSLKNHSFSKLPCKWPKGWVGHRSIIMDFYVHNDRLYVNFNKDLCIFRINWKKGAIKLERKIHLGYWEGINHIRENHLYYSSVYDYDYSIVYPGPHIGRLDLKTGKSITVPLSKKGIEFSHFPSKRIDFKHDQFLTTDVLDFKVRIYDLNLKLVDSVDLSSIATNTIQSVFFDYSKPGLSAIKEQDKKLSRIIKVYRSGSDDIHLVYKDTTCKIRNQYKICVLHRSEGTWNIGFKSEIINENESLGSPDFIPWLNSSSMNHILDHRLFHVGIKSITLKDSFVHEKKNFCIYMYNMVY
jgi:hypothetical protein